MARASGKTMKVDVALPLDIFETVVRLAEESDAPIHHRSNQRVLSPTILQLIGLGIQSLEDNPELLTVDISKRFPASDPRISDLLDRVEKLEGARFFSEDAPRTGESLTVDRVTEIAKDEIEQALNPVNKEMANLQTQVAKLIAMAQDDLDPAVIQTYLARRSERMAAETAALKANPPVNSRKKSSSKTI
jgi:hypothetical protein